MTRPHPHFTLIMCLLVTASSVSIMSTDIYAPSMPSLPALLDTSAGAVQLTISLNVLMFGLGQLLHGPLSERFGRRPVLLGAMLFFTFASFACALARGIEQLIAARMLQGFMGAAEAVVGLAIFADLFDEKQQVRALAIFGMSIAAVPALAPILGGYVHVYFNWRWNFYLLGVLGALTVLLLWQLLPESTAPDAGALRPARVFGDYLGLLRARQFIAHAGMAGVGAGILYAFITGAPFVLIRQLGVATEHFGYYQAVIVAAYFIGSMAAMRAVRHMPTAQLLRIGLAIVLLGGACLIALQAAARITPNTFTFAFAVMLLGLGPVFAVAPSKAMLATTRSAGAAAAMLGAIEMCAGGLAAGAVGVLHDGTARPLTLTIAALLLAAVVCMRIARGRAT
ncbi:MAG: multidrug effflux MFS transporter [Gammaproteobacteria bacterium]